MCALRLHHQLNERTAADSARGSGSAGAWPLADKRVGGRQQQRANTDGGGWGQGVVNRTWGQSSDCFGVGEIAGWREEAPDLVSVFDTFFPWGPVQDVVGE